MSLSFSQALVLPEKFQHILRVLNTNIDGKQKIMFGLTSIKVLVHLMITRNGYIPLRLRYTFSFMCRSGSISCMDVHMQGVGRRYANLVLKKADIDMNKRAGELTDEEVRRMIYSK